MKWDIQKQCAWTQETSWRLLGLSLSLHDHVRPRGQAGSNVFCGRTPINSLPALTDLQVRSLLQCRWLGVREGKKQTSINWEINKQIVMPSFLSLVYPHFSFSFIYFLYIILINFLKVTTTNYTKQDWNSTYRCAFRGLRVYNLFNLFSLSI